jgi:hypothetical protein
VKDPHAEVPTDRKGRPDDRFDGTDSGPGGWDTPYPPVDPDAPSDAPDPDESRADQSRRGPAARAPGGSQEDPDAVPARSPKRSADGTSYETDGPDDLAGSPQR